MAIIIVNPNSTVSMTEAMLNTARQVAPELIFEGWTSHDGPPAIQGAEDGEAASGPLLKVIGKAGAATAEGIIVGCFDDTAIAEAAARVTCPVIGLGQAAFHQCALRQRRFSVVTTLPVSIPVIEDNIARYGLAGHVGRVRASNVPVLALEQDPDATVEAILQTALAAQEEDDIDAVVLGCAGMVHVTRRLRASLSCEVVDPVVAAARAMLWLT